MPQGPISTSITPIRLAAYLLLAAAASCSYAAEQPQPLGFENALLSLWLSPRTPQQVAAFYEARGFPARALELLKQSCFVTVGIRNRSDAVVWLELDSWRFESGEGEIPRLDRSHWRRRWHELALPQADRSTFGWTLLPESRDLHPDEPVGGNITLPHTRLPFAVEARFATGANKEGPIQRMRIAGVRCARDRQP